MVVVGSGARGLEAPREVCLRIKLGLYMDRKLVRSDRR